MPISSTGACTFGPPPPTTGPTPAISKDPKDRKDHKDRKDQQELRGQQEQREQRGRKDHLGHKERLVLLVLMGQMDEQCSMVQRTQRPGPVPMETSTSIQRPIRSSGPRPVALGVPVFRLLGRRVPWEHKERPARPDHKERPAPMAPRALLGRKVLRERTAPMVLTAGPC